MTEHVVSAYKRMERIVPPGTWSAERVILALQDWAHVHGGPPRRHEWGSPESAPDAVGRARAEHWAREYPRWPSGSTVVKHLGSWEAALEAACLRARRLGPWELSLPERVETARRMSAEGASTSDIAGHLNVSAQTVRKYFNAWPCPDCAGPVVGSRAARCVCCAAKLATASDWTEQVICPGFSGVGGLESGGGLLVLVLELCWCEHL